MCAGKKYIIKVFCEIHSLFNNSYEPRYILNQLYIKDFLIWLQASPESLIESLHSMLKDVSLKKIYICKIYLFREHFSMFSLYVNFHLFICKFFIIKIHPSKASMGLDLVELEVAAYSVQEEGLVIENAVHEMVGQIDELCLNDSEKEK